MALCGHDSQPLHHPPPRNSCANRRVPDAVLLSPFNILVGGSRLGVGGEEGALYQTVAVLLWSGMIVSLTRLREHRMEARVSVHANVGGSRL